MNDLIALAGFIGALALIIAVSTGNPIGWLLREIALARADAWGESPSLPQDILTARNDPRCRRMVIRQRLEGQRLRRDGVTPRVRISCAWTTNPNAYRFAREAR